MNCIQNRGVADVRSILQFSKKWKTMQLPILCRCRVCDVRISAYVFDISKKKIRQMELYVLFVHTNLLTKHYYFMDARNMHTIHSPTFRPERTVVREISKGIRLFYDESKHISHGSRTYIVVLESIKAKLSFILYQNAQKIR